jgi:hypothetical protein
VAAYSCILAAATLVGECPGMVAMGQIIATSEEGDCPYRQSCPLGNGNSGRQLQQDNRGACLLAVGVVGSGDGMADVDFVQCWVLILNGPTTAPCVVDWVR